MELSEPRKSAPGKQCRGAPVEDPLKKVVTIGNSHVEQWNPVIKAMGEKESWEVIQINHGGCFYTTLEENKNALDQGQQCSDWFENAQEWADGWDPDVVFLQSTKSTYDGASEVVPDGVEDHVRHWTERGTDVIGLRDNPRSIESQLECEKTKSAEDCTYTHLTAQTADPTTEWETKYPGYGPAAFNDLICPSARCTPTVGNVYTYVDTDHLTATFVRSTQAFFSQRVSDALDRVDENRNRDVSHSSAA